MARRQKSLDGLRTCVDCNQTYPENNNYFYKTGPKYFYSYCKECWKIRKKTGKQSKPKTEPDENGNLTCRNCKAVLEANKDNFYIYNGKFIPECKPCRSEYERERYAKNRMNDLRRKMLKRAAETKEELSQCLKCNEYAPVSSFVEYDTNVYLEDKLLIKGYKYICGICWQMLYDATFAHIPGSYEIHKKRVGYVHKRKDRKGNKTKVS